VDDHEFGDTLRRVRTGERPRRSTSTPEIRLIGEQAVDELDESGTVEVRVAAHDRRAGCGEHLGVDTLVIRSGGGEGHEHRRHARRGELGPSAIVEAPARATTRSAAASAVGMSSSYRTGWYCRPSSSVGADTEAGRSSQPRSPTA